MRKRENLRRPGWPGWLAVVVLIAELGTWRRGWGGWVPAESESSASALKAEPMTVLFITLPSARPPWTVLPDGQ